MSKKLALLLGMLSILFTVNSARCNWIGQTILDTQKANNGALVFKVVFPRDPEREDRAKEIDDYLHESSTESESYSQKIDSKDSGCIQRYDELGRKKQGPRSGDVAECYSVIDGGHSQCLFTTVTLWESNCTIDPTTGFLTDSVAEKL